MSAGGNDRKHELASKLKAIDQEHVVAFWERLSPPEREHLAAQIDAIDAATGEILWTYTFDRIAFSGVTVVNDLLFTATLDGMVYALSRNDGKVVWQWQAPGGTNAWPAVAGDTIVWPFGLGDSPSVIALKLGGTGSIPTPEQQRTPVLTPEGN